jgi:hypothetical protein
MQVVDLLLLLGDFEDWVLAHATPLLLGFRRACTDPFAGSDKREITSDEIASIVFIFI